MNNTRTLFLARASSRMPLPFSMRVQPRAFHMTSLFRNKDPNSKNAQQDTPKPEIAPPKGSGATKEAQSQQSGSGTSTVDGFLEKVRPQLELAHKFYHTTKEQVNSVVVPMKFHWEKAKKALREANEKLDQQEKESESYAFKEDFTQDSGNNRHIIKGLPSERERNRKRWAKRLEIYIDSLQETIFTATRALNDVTGYSSIQKLRESIDVLEKEMHKAREVSTESKVSYNNATKNRMTTQKELNELLQRKNSWDPSDLERFTILYKQDQENSQFETEAKVKMEMAETHEEELQDKLSNAILTRYHEEQIWSDKIRRTSTWGTFGLMGLNILLFLIFQLALEPWKRRRLVGSFEQKVQKALEENAHQQNERLDIMSQKVEEMKNSDRLPALEERLESEINEEENDIVEPPEIRSLPLPPPEIRVIIQKIQYYLEIILEPFRSPFLLLFNDSYQEVSLGKRDFIYTTSSALLFGVVLGTFLNSIV